MSLIVFLAQIRTRVLAHCLCLCRSWICLLYGSIEHYGTVQVINYTAKIQYRKFQTNIPRKGIVRLRSQFPHSVCERFIYSHDRFAYSSEGKYVDRSWEYINRSQGNREIGNWGRRIPRKGIQKWDFRCSVALQFTVLYLKFPSVAAGPNINAAQPSSSFLRPLL